MAREPRPHEAHLFQEIYIDESSQSGPRFLAIGGIVFPRKYSAQFERAIIDARGERLPIKHPDGNPREIKWGNCGRGDFEAFKKVVDAFFDFRKQMPPTSLDSCRFHCSIVDTNIKGRSYSVGRKGQLGFSREMYFHCLLVAQAYYPKNLFHVYPDKRTSRTTPRELAIMLNRGIKLRGDTRDYPFRVMQPRHSHEVQALQVSDILLGALVYRLNKHYEADDATPDKKLLCDHILMRAGALPRIKNFGPNKSKNWGEYTFHVRKHPEVKKGPAALHPDSGIPISRVPTKGRASNDGRI